jgi:class 3 adenylate cyclase
VIDDARPDAEAATYRGFLFADLRGFTTFAERHGNAAAAERVARFLEIARAAIAQHEGAEIKTEGDAIHAVFPSASMAVMCGLEIVEAAGALGAQQGEGTLDLGVGVHAGEAVETDEGYIGTAVNIAARLCAVALPGEVLVTSTVKGITQASIPIGFISRGRRRLKGIREPVEVFAVTRDQTAYVSRTAPGRVVGGAIAAAIVLVVAIAVVIGAQGVAGPVATAGPSPTPVAQRIAIGPLGIGTYRSVNFAPEVAFEIRDLGWTANSDAPEILGLVREASPRGSVQLLRVQEVIGTPCGEGEGAATAVGAADLLTQLQGLAHLTVSEPKTVRIGGFVGREVEVDVHDEALAACGGLAGAEVTIFAVGKDIWSAASGERFRLIIVDVSGSAVTIAISADWAQTPSVQELESLFAYGERIVASARF